MEGPKCLLIVSVLVCLALAVEGKPKRSSDVDDIGLGLLPRPARNKQNGVDKNQELFDGLPEPESSAQQVSPTISGYTGSQGLGGQSSLLGNQGLYAGFQNQGFNPTLGQGQFGLNPYFGIGGLSSVGLGGNSGLGLGVTGFQNPYNILGGNGQDIYSQQAGLGLGGLGGSGGIYNQQSAFGLGGLGGNGIYNQQSALGGLGGLGSVGGTGGLYNTNPYLTQVQNPYLTNPYLQGGGLSTQFVGTNVNPYLLSRMTGYVNPYLGLGGSGGGLLGNPYANVNQINPYNNFPLTSRFGIGLGRGSLGSRTNTGQSSSSQSSSSSDE